MSRLDNLEGRVFGNWTVLRKAKPNAYENTYWVVRCVCGKEREITGRSLIYLGSTHCGCQRTVKLTKTELKTYKDKSRTASTFKDICGQVFGKLTVLYKTKQNNKKEWYWLCYCSCGNLTEVRGSHLRSGNVVSCGCYQSERDRSTHGQTYTKEYTHIRNKKRKKKEKYLDIEWNVEKEIFLRRLFQECVVCGMTEQEHQDKYGTSLHVDHVLPLKSGNGLSVGNATILCAKCNREKHARNLEDLPEHMKNRIQLTADLFKLLWEGQR